MASHRLPGYQPGSLWGPLNFHVYFTLGDGPQSLDKLDLYFLAWSLIDIGATFLDHFHDGLFELRSLFDDNRDVFVQQIPFFASKLIWTIATKTRALDIISDPWKQGDYIKMDRTKSPQQYSLFQPVSPTATTFPDWSGSRFSTISLHFGIVSSQVGL